MPLPKVLTFCLLALALIAGCGGQYTFTVPDQIATTGGSAAAVIRLQQFEFASLKRSIHNAPIRFSIADGPQRASFTDELGFAAVNVPAPNEPGRFELTISLQDADGDEAVTTAPTYVWKPESPVIAVDLDSLPTASHSDSAPARNAMLELSKHYKILYLTKIDPWRLRDARALVTQGSYPDGPILVWQRSYAHWTRKGKLKLPTHVVEAHLVSTLADLRKILPSLKIGLTGSAGSADLFTSAGLESIIVGSELPNQPARRFNYWAALALEGLDE